MNNQMKDYRVSIYRGGTSKGIFIKKNELPEDLEEKNKIIRKIFGSPDKRQIDGLGGADVLTSKLAIIGPSTREDADVDYTFAQVSFDTDLVDYGGNCGNISSAVGPYAINEGMVKITEPVTTVRIHQTNTNCILLADVEVKDGKACVNGNCSIDGVPGTGSKILLDFFDTAGSTTGKLLPTGNPKDTVHVEGYGDFEVSIVDAGNVLVFIEAASLGLVGTESCEEIEKNKALTDKIEAIRSTATVLIGMAKNRKEATEKSAYVPFFAIVSKPRSYVSTINNKKIDEKDIDIVSRLSFMLHMHKAYPGTGTVATGAAARIPGTIVYEQLSDNARKEKVLRIGHPSGIIEVEALADIKDNQIKFSHLAYQRTARRILDGTVYVRD